MLSRRHFHDCCAFGRSTAHLLGMCSSKVPKLCTARQAPGGVQSLHNNIELTTKAVNVRKIGDPQKPLLYSWPFSAIKQISARTCRDIPDGFECSSACLCGRWSLLYRIRLYFGFVSAEVWILQSHIWRGRPFKNPFWVFKRAMRKETGQCTSEKKGSLSFVCIVVVKFLTVWRKHVCHLENYVNYKDTETELITNICKISIADFCSFLWRDGSALCSGCRNCWAEAVHGWITWALSLIQCDNPYFPPHGQFVPFCSCSKEADSCLPIQVKWVVCDTGFLCTH